MSTPRLCSVASAKEHRGKDVRKVGRELVSRACSNLPPTNPKISHLRGFPSKGEKAVTLSQRKDFLLPGVTIVMGVFGETSLFSLCFLRYLPVVDGATSCSTRAERVGHRSHPSHRVTTGIRTVRGGRRYRPAPRSCRHRTTPRQAWKLLPRSEPLR